MDFVKKTSNKRKMNTINEIIQNKFISCIPKQILEVNDQYNIPSIDHCLGYNKLLGENLSEVLLYEIKLNKKKYQSLKELFMFLRAYIVIDDYINDHYINDEKKIFFLDWLKNIENNIIALISIFNVSEIKWINQRNNYFDAFHEFNKRNIFQSIINKCSLIFLPFEFDAFGNINSKNQLLHILQYYLFGLQLIDDLQDMNEDMIAPKNHNIYLNTIPKEYYKSVSQNKKMLLNSLFLYIESNLKSVNFTLNPIIKKYCLNSIYWMHSHKIAEWRITNNYFSGKFEKFQFNYKLLLNENCNLKVDLSSDIKAENMHTIKVKTDEYNY